MLNDAASKAKPTKYAQNKCHGTYEGTPIWMNCAAERCSAPKTARGSAKHKLLKTTTLSRPRACAMSVFTAHSAIRKSTMAVPDIDAGVRENSNMARMVKFIGMGRWLNPGKTSPGLKRLHCTTKSRRPYPFVTDSRLPVTNAPVSLSVVHSWAFDLDHDRNTSAFAALLLLDS